MRNAVIMMTANPTEDVVADSPPSAPSGRFGGHPRSGRETGLLPATARPQRRCERAVRERESSVMCRVKKKSYQGIDFT